MTAHKKAEITARAIGLILRQKMIVSEQGFNELWSETASGAETHGSRDLLWTTFVREHDTDYWYKRIWNQIVRRRQAGLL